MHTMEKNGKVNEGVKQDRINIPRGTFERAILSYPEETRGKLEWLWGYAFEELHGSKRGTGDAIGYHWTVLHKVFTGKYGAGMDRIIEAIDNLRKKVSSGRNKLVRTVVVDRIIEALDYAQETQTIVTITGTTGRSKTFTAQHWARDNNHGRSRYVRVPSNCTRKTLVTLLAGGRGISTSGGSCADMESKLFRTLDFRNTLIIDEAGHLLPKKVRGSGTIEFVRDLHDICGCGVALIFTDVYLQDFKYGPNRGYFEQYIGRTEFPVVIPEEVTKNEVEAVVKSYRKDPPVKMLQLSLDIARSGDGKLRTLFKDLKKAKKWADDNGHEINYDDLKLARDWRNSGTIWPE